MAKFELPYDQHLLKRVQEIEEKLLAWYKKNIYAQGDDYQVSITASGKWRVSYSNDYPLQHGKGEDYIFTPEQFKEITK